MFFFAVFSCYLFTMDIGKFGSKNRNQTAKHTRKNLSTHQHCFGFSLLLLWFVSVHSWDAKRDCQYPGHRVMPKGVGGRADKGI